MGKTKGGHLDSRVIHSEKNAWKEQKKAPFLQRASNKTGLLDSEQLKSKDHTPRPAHTYYQQIKGRESKKKKKKKKKPRLDRQKAS